MAKKSVLNAVRPKKVIYPIIIGLGVVIYLMVSNFDSSVLPEIAKITTSKTVFWIGIALLLMIVRDFGYMMRLLVLSDGRFTWKQAFRIVLLWEFTSAITPSAIGGTSVAILFLNKEGLSIGKSSAIVMATSFLDELYFILVFPIVLLIINTSNLFTILNQEGIAEFKTEFFYFALIGYGLKLIYTLFISYGLFINPRGLRWLLIWVFKLPVLRRWKLGAVEAGREIETSSKELRKKPITFWLKAFGATLLSWTSRYWVVNAIFLSFFFVSDHFLLYARQLVAWIMMLISPTPGGSGFSEGVFIKYLGDFLPFSGNSQTSFATLLAFIWRLISYYPYLILGLFIYPRWISSKFGKKQAEKHQSGSSAKAEKAI